MRHAITRPCPACGNAQMQIVPVRMVEIDVCPNCEGAWFDGGELTAVLEGPRVGRLLATARAGASTCWSCKSPVRESDCTNCGAGQLACPECGRNGLVTVEEDGVELDVCVPCGGFWFDKGELEAIAGEKSPNLATVVGSPAPAAPGESNRVTCAECGRHIRRAHAFREGRDTYCGSCAPAGASQLEVDIQSLRKKAPLFGETTYGHYHSPESGSFLLSILGWLMRS